MNDGNYITFTNTIDDIVAFNMYHLAHSPTARRIKFWSTWGIVLVVLGIAAVLSLLGESFAPLIFAAIWMLFVLPIALSYKWTVRRRVVKLIREGKNKGVLGAHTLRIDEDGLHETSEVSEGKTLWSGIERIGEDEEYLFVYVQAMMAHVIPRNRIDAGDLQAFTDELRRRVGQSE